jgi:hypothetical protein
LGLEPRPAGPGFFTIYRTSAGEPAFDSLPGGDQSEHSVFARVLLSQMKVRGLELGELARRVREEVARLTKNAQRPAYYDEAIGRVYLAGRREP